MTVANNEKILEAVNQGYKVSLDGMVFSPSRKTYNKGHRSGPYGYMHISIYYNGYKKGVKVHRLQAYQKYGEAMFEPGIVVRHLNGNRLDNSWDNIAIGTTQDNMMDRTPEQRVQSASHGGRATRKLTWEQVENIRKDRIESGDSMKKLGLKYGVCAQAVCKILNGRSYKNE